MSATLRFDRVCRGFDEKPVLRGLSFSVQPGEVFALLGRNGEGKTTAMRILLGLLRAHSGRSEVLGVDSTVLDSDTRERIAFVSEDHKLYDRSISMTLDFEAATRQRFQRALAIERIRKLGLPLDATTKKLSRGQRAQLALVLALAGEPEVLVLDDPGLGLDAVMRRELLDAMIELLSEHGATVLFSSHALADVERIADRVGILSGGRLLVDAPVEGLRTRVQQCFLRAASGVAGSQPPPLPGLLASRRRDDGYELTLLDPQESSLQDALGNGARISSPVALPLEELFVQLTDDATQLHFEEAAA